MISTFRKIILFKKEIASEIHYYRLKIDKNIRIKTHSKKFIKKFFKVLYN